MAHAIALREAIEILRAAGYRMHAGAVEDALDLLEGGRAGDRAFADTAQARGAPPEVDDSAAPARGVAP